MDAEIVFFFEDLPLMMKKLLTNKVFTAAHEFPTEFHHPLGFVRFVEFYDGIR